MDLKNLTRVVQFTVPKTFDALMQRFGRGARDPAINALCILLAEPEYFDDVKIERASAAEKRKANAVRKQSKKRAKHTSATPGPTDTQLVPPPDAPRKETLTHRPNRPRTPLTPHRSHNANPTNYDSQHDEDSNGDDELVRAAEADGRPRRLRAPHFSSSPAPELPRAQADDDMDIDPPVMTGDGMGAEELDEHDPPPVAGPSRIPPGVRFERVDYLARRRDNDLLGVLMRGPTQTAAGDVSDNEGMEEDVDVPVAEAIPPAGLRGKTRKRKRGGDDSAGSAVDPALDRFINAGRPGRVDGVCRGKPCRRDVSNAYYGNDRLCESL